MPHVVKQPVYYCPKKEILLDMRELKLTYPFEKQLQRNLCEVAEF